MARREPRLGPNDSPDALRQPSNLIPGPWLIVALASATAFLVVAGAIRVAGTLPFDASIEAFVRALPVPEAMWATITQLGNLLLILIGTATALAALASGRWRLAAIVALALVAAAMFTGAAKLMVDRPRPPAAVALGDGLSFPSGHALNSTVTYGILALLAWRSRLSQAVRAAAVTVFGLLPVVIGISRVGLGLHWPSDVVAGWLAGLLFLSLAAAASRYWSADEPDVVLRWSRTDPG